MFIGHDAVEQASICPITDGGGGQLRPNYVTMNCKSGDRGFVHSCVSHVRDSGGYKFGDTNENLVKGPIAEAMQFGRVVRMCLHHAYFISFMDVFYDGMDIVFPLRIDEFF